MSAFFYCHFCKTEKIPSFTLCLVDIKEGIAMPLCYGHSVQRYLRHYIFTILVLYSGWFFLTSSSIRLLTLSVSGVLKSLLLVSFFY